MTIFFTSDLHFGHANIIEYCDRPFSGVTEMNEALIENWNNTVSDTDLVYVLGDVCMGKIADTLPLVSRLNGNKRLVPGNHDRCWPGNGSKHEQWISKYQEVGLPITKEKFVVIDGYFFFINHFPYEGDSHEEDRYVEWRPIDQGSWLLCGHVHNAWVHRGRQINVGTDVWNYRPVSANALIDFYNYKRKA